MKKLFSYAMLLLIFCVSLVGCGETISGIDANKTQIYIGVYNGGYGYNWLQDAADVWNARSENSEYEVVVVPDTTDGITLENLQAGTNMYDVYFSTEIPKNAVIEGGWLLDLSDVLTTKNAGESKTVGDKLLFPQDVEYAMRHGEQLIALPYGDSLAGLVFDYDLFLKKGWLFYQKDTNGNILRDENNEPMLTVGRDGVYGTYDDGQPNTLAEWDEMIGNILAENQNDYAFCFTTKFPFYMQQLIDAMFAQYQGADEFNSFIKAEGVYTDAGGNPVTVTLQEGYKVYDMPGLERALWFVDEYFSNNKRYVLPQSWETSSFSHKDAQNAFITGFNETNANPLGAMLVDGVWWENEARTLFASLEANGYDDRAYGEREYRMMLLPMLEGSQGGNGDGTGSAVAAMDCGTCYAIESRSAEKNEKIKNFLAYTCSDEVLKAFTLANGSVRPFDYQLSDDELAQLTPFQRNVWEMYHDRENITIVRPTIMTLGTPLYASSSKLERYQVNTAYTQMFSYLTRYNSNQALEALRAQNSQANWSIFYEEAVGGAA